VAAPAGYVWVVVQSPEGGRLPSYPAATLAGAAKPRSAPLTPRQAPPVGPVVGKCTGGTTHQHFCDPARGIDRGFIRGSVLPGYRRSDDSYDHPEDRP
jgi:hypothetical protein